MIEETLVLDPTLPLRRRSRVIALQTLYEVDLVGHSDRDVLLWILSENSVPPDAEQFARSLVQGVIAQKTLLDQWIGELAPVRPVSQLAVVDRNLLRMALHEILIERSVPPKVAINEAVELAKMFGSESSPRFINGVLGAAMEKRPHLRPTTLSTSAR
ncbi:MAG: transcription antitermination factor NusB [Chloroflexi bacterium]|nr:transcription antitermination factor NusB [Chloroflexota bacterium]